MVERVDVVVVGGGVVGSSAAWHLARRGRDVVLLERFGVGQPWGASHGTSRIFRTTYTQPEYLDLAVEARAQWGLLERETGEQLLTLTGGVSHGGADLGALRAAFVERGIPHELLSPSAAAERWPGMRFDDDVLLETETAGRLHADRSVAALQTAARAHGADVRLETPVHRLEAVGDGGVVVHTDGGPLLAGTVVLAAGAWTNRLFEGLGHAPLPLRVTQEQPAHFALALGAPAEEAWPAFTHAITGPPWPSGVYGLASPGEGIKVGFHAVGPELVDPDVRDFQAEPGQLRLLRRYVAEWLPGLDPEWFEPISCTYTTTPDSNFVLDRRGDVVVAAGFSGHGFKFGSVVGRVLADLVEGRAAADLFAIARLSTLPG